MFPRKTFSHPVPSGGGGKIYFCQMFRKNILVLNFAFFPFTPYNRRRAFPLLGEYLTMAVFYFLFYVYTTYVQCLRASSSLR